MVSRLRTFAIRKKNFGKAILFVTFTFLILSTVLINLSGDNPSENLNTTVNDDVLSSAIPDFSFNRTYGDTRDDSGYGICGVGSYLYTVGKITSTETYDADLSLIKWDLKGNVVWAKTFRTGSDDLGMDIWANSTEIYTVGYSGSTSSSDVLLIKWDLNGNIVWKKTWGSGGSNKGYGVWGDGVNIYVTGTTNNIGAGDNDAILLKWDAAGNVIWAKTWGNSNPNTGDKIVGNGPFLYMIGDTDYYDFLLVKWDKDGNEIWNATWDNGGKNDWGVDLVVLGASIYLLGYTNGPSAGTFIYALVRFSDQGAFLQKETWGGATVNWARSIWTDGSYLYVAGSSKDVNTEKYNVIFQKWSTSLSLVWSKTWGGSSNDDPAAIWGTGVYFYITGYTSSYGSGGNDILLLKIGKDVYYPPAAPVMTTLPWNMTYNSSAYLTWSNITEASSYNIYKEKDLIQDVTYLTPIASSTNLFYNDTFLTNATYFWAVVSVNATGESSPSNCVFTIVLPNPSASTNTGSGTTEDSIAGFPMMVMGIISMVGIIGVIIRQKRIHENWI
jgi:hypothetical protein